MFKSLVELNDDLRTLELYKVEPLDYLLWEEMKVEVDKQVPDTDANYRESGFAGSNLLSGSSVTMRSLGVPQQNLAKSENCSAGPEVSTSENLEL